MSLDPKHFVNVGKRGTFAPSGTLASDPDQVDALFAHLRQQSVDKLVLHFHGGLVKEAAGIAIAQKLHQTYTGAGCHPVFFVWETGLGETLKANLGSIHGTTLFQKLTKYALKYAAKKLGVGPEGARGDGDAPMTFDEIDAQLAGDRFEAFDVVARSGAERIDPDDLETDEQMLAAELEVELAADEELEAAVESVDLDAAPDEALRQQLATPEGARGALEIAIALGKYLAKVVIGVVKRYLGKTQHGFYPTLVEELLRTAYLANLGEWVWKGMKDQARWMWEPNDGLSGLDQRAGRYFLDRLSALQKERGFALDLVGHSAGSIAIGEMLDEAAKSAPVSVRNVALLAPAIRSDQFLRQYVDPAPARFDALRVYTMSDAYEAKDRLASVAYPRSLLYFISGVLEGEPGTPLLGLQRYWSDPPHQSDVITRVGRWVAGQGRHALSVTADGASDGFGTRSVSHGGFDDDDHTKASLAHFLA